VIHWNAYTDAQKRIIDQRLAGFLAKIVATKLILLDQSLLRRQLDAQQINYPLHKSPYIWAYELLRAGASQIDNLSHYGLQVNAAYLDYPLKQLRLLIDEEFYLLSCAHYERYFELGSDTLRQRIENNK
jgi:hypothetical protein